MPRKKTHEEFVAEVKALVGDEYTVVGTYINSKTKIDILHSKCCGVYSVVPNSFLRGTRCPMCFSDKLKQINSDRRIHHTKFVDIIKSKYGDKFTIMSKYKQAHKKINVFCNECKIEFKVTPNNLKFNGSCPSCANYKRSLSNRKPKEVLKVELLNMFGNEYSLVSNYTTCKQKSVFKHNLCGRTFKKSATALLQGQGCPFCATSKGEKAISRFLDSNDIEYEAQYRIGECRDKRALPFDFAVLKNGKLALIEYDGEQHFVPKDYFGGEIALRQTQRRDRIKDKYCADHGIPLIRIPYWDFDNIDAILTEKLLPLLKERAA